MHAGIYMQVYALAMSLSSLSSSSSSSSSSSNLIAHPQKRQADISCYNKQ